MLKEKKDFSLDAAETTILHREIILRKPFLKKLYEEWYDSFIKIIPQLPQGNMIEIGSGGGFLKERCPQIITSDILPLPHCDMVFAAQKMPFENNSVAAIFMIDVLHHIPNSLEFFAEAERILTKNGKIFMIEPSHSIFARFIYKKFHHEPYDDKTQQWNFPSSGPLSGANGALPWIIFERDINIFHKKFKNLKLESIKLHTPFRYLLSGGLSYKFFSAKMWFKPFSFIEKLFSPLNSQLAMFQTIIIQKL